MTTIKCGHIKGSKARIYTGFRLYPCGRTKKDFFQSRDFTRCGDPQPVWWQGEPAELRYWNWKSKRVPFNRTAAGLITHPGFVVRGEAIVTIRAEHWHQFRVLGDEEHARSLVSHLGLIDPEHVIFMAGGRHRTHTHIFVRDQSDAFAVRMAI